MSQMGHEPMGTRESKPAIPCAEGLAYLAGKVDEQAEMLATKDREIVNLEGLLRRVQASNTALNAELAAMKERQRQHWAYGSGPGTLAGNDDI